MNPTQQRRRSDSAIPGCLLALVVALAATAVGLALPVLGGPVAAVLIGAVVATWVRPARRWPTVPRGLRLTGALALQCAVVLLGTQISLAQAWEVGGSALPVMIATLAAAFGAAWLLGRWMGIEDDLRTLVGVGTAICGASAIAAVTPVLRAKPTTVAYAMSTIFVFNIAAVLIFPWIGHALGMSQHSFGVFAGTAVNDTSSVVAASAVYGDEATHTAVVVKLTRSLAIIPVVLIVAAVVARRTRRAAALVAAPAGPGTGADGDPAVDAAARPSILKLVPWFLVGFVALAAVNSVVAIPAGVSSGFALAAGFLITWALAAIGLSTDLAALRRTGMRPLLFGGALWLVVSLTSLGVQAVTMR